MTYRSHVSELIYRVLYILEFPVGVAVDASALGTRWDVPASPHSTTVALPGRPELHDDSSWVARALHRPTLDGATTAFEWFEERGDEDPVEPFWGQVFQWNGNTGDVQFATLTRALAVVDVAEAPDDQSADSNATGRALSDWVSAACGWLEVFAGATLAVEHAESRMTPFVYPLPLAEDGTGGWRNYPTMHQMMTAHVTRAAANLTHWANAVDAVAHGRERPTAYVLLRDSRAAWRREEYRRAVIDATTAVEVAFAAGIRRRLELNGSTDAVDQLLKSLNGVVQLYHVARAIGAECGVSLEKLQHQIAGRRNLAAHEGRAPSKDETHQTLMLADDIVRTLHPLPGSLNPWKSAHVATSLEVTDGIGVTDEIEIQLDKG